MDEISRDKMINGEFRRDGSANIAIFPLKIITQCNILTEKKIKNELLQYFTFKNF